MAISSSIGTPYSWAASANSAVNDAPGEGPAWAKTLAAPTDPSRATPSSPEPASFRNSPRSNVLMVDRGDSFDDRWCEPKHIPPPPCPAACCHVDARYRTRYVTIIIRMHHDAGQRFAGRNSSLRYIFGRTIFRRQYTVVIVRPTNLPIRF